MNTDLPKNAQDTAPPEIDFTTFILSLSTAAYMGMGVVPFQEKGALEMDLGLAKLNIDTLKMLLSKTKGNLSAEEEKLISQLLFELQLKFSEKKRQK